MEILCTICCKDKRTDPGLVPAIDRYRSGRIAFVNRESRVQGKPMFILSGKFGLLRPEDPIPWYDLKLEINAVPGLVPVIEGQLKEMKVTRITFYSHPKSDANWYPYHAALEQACQKRDISIHYHFLDLE